jgi:isopentenyl diphosphate isomerase/L-lactate dehydrogenase-like FMN-dependent dehydrogenase
VPRALRDVAGRALGVEILGRRLPAPLLLAPLGVQEILHDDAEIAVARAARGFGVPFNLSTVASRTIEQVAAAIGRRPALVPALRYNNSTPVSRYHCGRRRVPAPMPTPSVPPWLGRSR